MKQRIVVTGGAGYIGGHMAHYLVDKGYDVIVIDNLSTGHKEFIPKRAKFFQLDLRDKEELTRLLIKLKPQAVMHFAAFIVVPESVTKPLKYFENNVGGTLSLLSAMEQAKVNKLVFSSTAVVYDPAISKPISENDKINPLSPYAQSKWLVEQILAECSKAQGLRYAVLRYFNVAGSHPDWGVGIKMLKPTHLIPNITRAFAGKQGEITIFGHKYPTKDGTCVRDYIYVVDLCEAHWLALKALQAGMPSNVFNLGSGKGFTVKEVVEAAKQVLNIPVKVNQTGPRAGDIPYLVASFRKAKRLLGWQPKASLKEIIKTAWAWENRNG